MLNFWGSPMILSICKNFGEVASMKVKKLDKFKKYRIVILWVTSSRVTLY